MAGSDEQGFPAHGRHGGTEPDFPSQMREALEDVLRVRWKDLLRQLADLTVTTASAEGSVVAADNGSTVVDPAGTLNYTSGLRVQDAGGGQADIDVLLATDSGLEFSGSALRVKVSDGLERTASGLAVDLGTDPGLEFVAGELLAKVGAGLLLTVSGIEADFGTGAGQIAEGDDSRFHSHANKAVLDAINTAGSGDVITTSERGRLPTQDEKDGLANAPNALSSSNPVADKQYVDAAIDGLDHQESVLDKDLATPPVSPTAGDRYIVASGGTGDWSTHDDEIAEWDGSVWVFGVPNEGWTTYVEDENKRYIYTGASWTKHSGVEDLVAGAGLTKSSDTIDVGQGDGIQVNADDVAVRLTATDPGLEIDGGDGGLSVVVGDGLAKSAAGVIVDLEDTTPGLQFVTGDLAVLAGDGVTVTASGVEVDLATDPGLEFATGRLRAKVANGIQRTASGIEPTYGTATNTVCEGDDSRLHTHSNQAVLDALTDAGSGSVITSAERTALQDARHIQLIPKAATVHLDGAANDVDVIDFYDSTNKRAALRTTGNADAQDVHLIFQVILPPDWFAWPTGDVIDFWLRVSDDTGATGFTAKVFQGTTLKHTGSKQQPTTWTKYSISDSNLSTGWAAGQVLTVEMQVDVDTADTADIAVGSLAYEIV